MHVPTLVRSAHIGSGNPKIQEDNPSSQVSEGELLAFPGSLNWYVPDIAVVTEELTRGARALLPSQTLLVVEVTSAASAETDRVVKRKRYAEYGAPLYLLVDRMDKTVTLFAEPGRLGYTKVDGPHPFGTPVRLPEPFDLDLDTSEL